MFKGGVRVYVDGDLTPIIVARYLHRYNDDTRPAISMESFCYQCNSKFFFSQELLWFLVNYFLRFCSPVCVCVRVCFR